MPENFDPYYEWLGIPPRHQPPNHYRLLGIELFEANPNVIERAADRQMAHVRTFQTGKHSRESQTLLNEVSAARLCLLDAAKKAEYDAALRAELGVPEPPPATRQAAEPIVVGVPVGRPVIAARFGKRPPPRGQPAVVIAVLAVVASSLLLPFVVSQLVSANRGSSPVRQQLARPRGGSLPADAGARELAPAIPLVSPASAEKEGAAGHLAWDAAGGSGKQVAGSEAAKGAGGPGGGDSAAKGEAPASSGGADKAKPAEPAEKPKEPAEKPKEAAPAKQPVPPDADIKAAMAKVKESFKERLRAARYAPELISQAAELLRRARGESDVPLRYALLTEARRLAVEAVNPHFALRAVRDLDTHFQVDPWSLKAETITRLATEAKTAGHRRAIGEIALELAEEAAAQGHAETADRLLATAFRLTRFSDHDLARQINLRRESLVEPKKVVEGAGAGERRGEEPKAESPAPADAATPAAEAVGERHRVSAHTRAIAGLAVSCSGRWVLTGAADGTLGVWDVIRGRETLRLGPGAAPLLSVSLSPDQKFAIAAAANVTAVWSLAQRTKTVEIKTDGRIRDSAIFADGRLLWARSAANTKNVIMSSFVLPPVAVEHNFPGRPFSLALSASGRWIAVANDRRQVVVLDLEAKRMAELTGNTQAIQQVAFSPNERMLAACSPGEILLWDLATRKERHRLHPARPAARVAFSPDGARLLSAGVATELTLWDVASGTLVQVLTSPEGTAPAAADVDFLPDALGAVSAGNDGVLRIWRLPE